VIVINYHISQIQDELINFERLCSCILQFQKIALVKELCNGSRGMKLRDIIG